MERGVAQENSLTGADDLEQIRARKHFKVYIICKKKSETKKKKSCFPKSMLFGHGKM